MNIHRLFGRGCCSVPDCIPVVQQFTPDPDDDPDEYPFVPGFEQPIWGIHWVCYRNSTMLSPTSYKSATYSTGHYSDYHTAKIDSRLKKSCPTIKTLSFNDR
jgi:hypothetical protein